VRRGKRVSTREGRWRKGKDEPNFALLLLEALNSRAVRFDDRALPSSLLGEVDEYQATVAVVQTVEVLLHRFPTLLLRPLEHRRRF
jgi:hypothetical protein